MSFTKALQKFKNSRYQKVDLDEEGKKKKIDNVLNFGGEILYEYKIGEKTRKIHVSVDNGQRINKNIPKYKFHVRNAQGYRVFIKASSRKIAQETVNSIFGKGFYTVSGSDV